MNLFKVKHILWTPLVFLKEIGRHPAKAYTGLKSVCEKNPAKTRGTIDKTVQIEHSNACARIRESLLIIYKLNIPILPMAFLTFAGAKVGSAPPFV